MSQEKIEAIILTEDGIMIQEIDMMVRSGYTPNMRVPSMEELSKIADGCTESITRMREIRIKQTDKETLLEMMFNEMVEKHGPKNVSKGDGYVTVTDNGKDHKIWIETV